MRSSASSARSNRSAYAAPNQRAIRGGPSWTSPTRTERPLKRLWRWVRRRRRFTASLLLCLAAAVAVQQLTPTPPATVTVMVAVRDLPAGHTLTPVDMTAAAVSPGMVPDGTVNTHNGTQQSNGGAFAWVGARLSGPVRRGEVVTDAALLGDGLLVGAPPGSQAVPLRLTDSTTVQLLRQGQLVDVIISSSKGMDGPVQNSVLAHSVAVLWTPALASSGSGLLPAQDTEGLVVVAATPSQAILLAGASARGKIFLVLVK